jgi:hypothetical protein
MVLLAASAQSRNAVMAERVVPLALSLLSPFLSLLPSMTFDCTFEKR